jgi:hypothetical protein
VLQLERLQELAEDLAAPALVDLRGIVFDDVPDGAAFEALLLWSDSECAGHFANPYLVQIMPDLQGRRPGPHSSVRACYALLQLSSIDHTSRITPR